MGDVFILSCVRAYGLDKKAKTLPGIRAEVMDSIPVRLSHDTDFWDSLLRTIDV